MLRLPRFEQAEPESLDEALALLAEHGDEALPIAGGTDLVPNMKHRLFEPKLLVSLARIPELAGIRGGPSATNGETGAPDSQGGALVIGAMTRIAEVAADARVRERAPALAQAASLIAGPQLRTMGTLGGNVMLDTRCQWYNQTYFWRKSLGFCLKKDGTLCHVVEGANKCIAAASNDTAPALMSLDATLVFRGGEAGRREVPIDELWKADGIHNKKTEPGELLTEIHIPPRGGGAGKGARAIRHRGAYGKLRDRGSIDFPLFGCAVRLDLDAEDRVVDADLCTVALVARPARVQRVAAELVGTRPGTEAFDRAVEAVCALAHRQCRPMDNVPGDAEYRREMVPVYVRRTLQAAAQGTGPVHHL